MKVGLYVAINDATKHWLVLRRYHLFRPWLRWLPLPVLVWFSKRHFDSVIWYQDEQIVIRQERMPKRGI